MPLPGIVNGGGFASVHLLPLVRMFTARSSCDLDLRDAPKEYKLSDALNKVGYCMRLWSASFRGSIHPGPTSSRVVADAASPGTGEAETRHVGTGNFTQVLWKNIQYF